MENPVELFYTAFKNKDAEAMVALYADDVVFTDPAFGELKGESARNMWRMLLKNGKDMSVVFSKVTSDSANWIATYTFSQTGRKVVNNVSAKFEIENGKIVKHTDSFHLRGWAKQALGFKGALLGGTSFFKKKLNAQTNGLLAKFEAGRNE